MNDEFLGAEAVLHEMMGEITKIKSASQLIDEAQKSSEIIQEACVKVEQNTKTIAGTSQLIVGVVNNMENQVQRGFALTQSLQSQVGQLIQASSQEFGEIKQGVANQL